MIPETWRSLSTTEILLALLAWAAISAVGTVAVLWVVDRIGVDADQEDR